MYVFAKLVAFLAMLWRVFGVTPDTIKAVNDKDNRLRLTAKEIGPVRAHALVKDGTPADSFFVLSAPNFASYDDD
jgi:hypothetical protein